MGTPIIPSVDSDTKQLPDAVRARIAANIMDQSTLEGQAALSAAAGNVADAGSDVVLLVGQSNEVSFGTGIDLTYLDMPETRVKQFASSGTYVDQAILAIDPLFHPLQQANTVGNGPAFGKQYSRIIPTTRDVLLVPAAYGSTGFSTTSLTPPPSGYSTVAGGTWARADQVGGVNRRDYAIAQANKAVAAGRNNRIVAVIWIQGEADTNAMSAGDYQTALDGLIADFRTRITGASDVPFLVGQMIPERVASSTQAAAQNTVHVETQARLTRTGFFYGPSGMNLGDNLHYSAAGQREIGNYRILPALLRARANVLGTAPEAPKAPTLTQTGTTVTVQISRPAARYTDFNVQYRINGGAWTQLGRSKSVDHIATIVNLTTGANLEVQTRSANEQGVSAWSAIAMLSLASPPSQVTGLSAGNPTSTTTPLTWNQSAGATSYVIEYRPTGSSAWTTGPSSSSTQSTVTGLLSATSYDFRVTAVNAGGSATPSATTTATTATPTKLLDDVGTTAYWAYGLRKLRGSYAGSAVRVRRSTDNAETDIAFTSGGDFDAAALTAFVGGGSGYISRWYDQSGNNRDLVETATTASQPRIVNAGSVDVQNGKPAVYFDGTDDRFQSTATGLYSAGASTTMGAVSVATTAASFATLFAESGTGTAKYAPMVIASTGGLQFQLFDDSNTNNTTLGATTGDLRDGVLRQLTMLDSGSVAQAYKDGVAQVMASNGAYSRTGRTVTLTRLGLGAIYSTFFFKGYVGELVAFPAALSATQRQAGEANTKAFFGTA